MRKSTFLWLGLAAISAAALFHTSQQVTDGREKLAVIEHDIQKEEETLRVLQAEWSYLNQPDRLEKLVKQYLQLEPMKGRQFAKIDKLEVAAPEKAEAPADATAPQETAAIADPEAPPADEPAAVIVAPAPAAPEEKAVEMAISTAKGSADEAVVAGEATPPKPGKKLQKQATESAAVKPAKPADKKPVGAAAKPAVKTEKKPQQADSRNFDDMMKGLTKP